MQDLLSDLDLAVSAAYKAGEIVKYHQEIGVEKIESEKSDPVTNLDLLVDSFLYESLLDQTPDYGWISEEHSTTNVSGRDRIWVVDPIDGTENLIRGLDDFTISIGLVEHGYPVLGVIYNPVRDQMFSSLRGHGVFLNGQRMYSYDQCLEDSLLLMPMGTKKKPNRQAIINSVSQSEEVGSIAYRMALIAAGQADITLVDHDLCIWDILAGVTMVEEQGFEVKCISGESLNLDLTKPCFKLATEGIVVCKESLFDDIQKRLL